MKLHKKIKSEKGSITLFVLVSLLFFLMVSFNIYAYNKSSQQAQLRECDEIIKNYRGSKSIDEIYNDVVNNT